MEIPPTYLYVVAGLLVDTDGRVLVQKRPQTGPMAGLWEFPGGKIEQGETPEQALVRELQEELGIDTHESCLAPAAFASEPLGDKHLLLLLFACRKWHGTAQALQADALKWVRPVDLFALDMPPADRPLLGIINSIL